MSEQQATSEQIFTVRNVLPAPRKWWQPGTYQVKGQVSFGTCDECGAVLVTWSDTDEVPATAERHAEWHRRMS